MTTHNTTMQNGQNRPHRDHTGHRCPTRTRAPRALTLDAVTARAA
ncbi:MULTISPECIES: hypothetical protein [unclassified Pseudonocardia]|nr:hypothetical protein [Pseudonocardia sp. Ae706_Ps2]